MSLKNIKIKSAFAAITLLTTTNVYAKFQYHAGLGLGIGLFEFNGDKGDATFQGDLAVVAGQANPLLRTTYKYVDNQPQRALTLDFGYNNTVDAVQMLDRTFFYGASLGLTWNKFNNSAGLVNSNAKYMNTGSTGLFFAINSRFGLENPYSKLFGILGFTYAKTDLPFDILPLGSGTALGDLGTCVVTGNGTSIPNAGIQNACNQIKVDDASYNTFFVNLGIGVETKVTDTINLFADYVYFLQLNKNKEHSVKYSVNGVEGTFRGKIKTTNTQAIKMGIRYYF